VTSIGEVAFCGCKNLMKITVEAINPRTALLQGDNFPENEGMKIYVYSEEYKTDLNWNTYVDYIEVVPFTIYFDAGKGYFEVSSISAIYNQPIPILQNKYSIPTRTGYTFQGFYTGEDGTGTRWYNKDLILVDKDGDRNHDSYPYTRDLTLFAYWKLNGYYLVLDANGGRDNSGNTTKEIALTYEQKYTFEKDIFYRPGYVFVGWSSTQYTSDFPISISYIEVGDTYSKLSSEEDSRVTMYAVWWGCWSYRVQVPEGTGAKDSPYLISKATELAWIARQTEEGNNLSGKYFKQTANINLSNYRWSPIGSEKTSFKGYFDGNNYVLSGLLTTSFMDCNDEYLSSYQGLFGKIENATIKNVNLFTSSVYGFKNIGGLVGWSAKSTIEACSFYGSVYGTYQVGGLLGHNEQETKISKCYISSVIRGKGNTGGIVGSTRYAAYLESCVYINNDNDSSDNPNHSLAPISFGFGYIKNCYAKCNSSIKTIVVDVTQNCLYELNGDKKCSNGTFSDWVILNNKPMPSGLTWMGNVGTKVTNIEQIYALGYTPF